MLQVQAGAVLRPRVPAAALVAAQERVREVEFRAGTGSASNKRKEGNRPSGTERRAAEADWRIKPSSSTCSPSISMFS